MTLKYKISISILAVSLVILSSVSYIYSKLSYESIMKHEKKNLMDNSIDSIHHIEADLLDKLSNALTIASAPIVLNTLQKSNFEYRSYTKNARNEQIKKLNEKWMKSDIEDEFVKSRLNNNLAQFLKKQQTTLPGIYGELFITNKYGTMIASTAKLTTMAHSHKYWWKESFNEGKGKVFFDDRGFDASVKGYVIGVVIPIIVDDNIVGILKANVNIMNTLSKMVANYKALHNGSLKIVRTKGLVVYEDGKTPLSTRVSTQLLDKLKYRATGTIILNNFGKEFLVSYSPVSLTFNKNEVGFGGKPTTLGNKKGNEGEIWHAVISYDEKAALFDSNKTNKMIIYTGLLITLISAIIAFLIGRWISKPIDELSLAQEKLKLQEKILIAQSRHAAMGEMISMIAHQWRQPITVIAMGANNLILGSKLDNLNQESIEESAKKILQQTVHLSKTMDDFKNFFNPNKSKDFVGINEILEENFEIIDKSLENNNIKIEKNYHSKTKTFIYSRELLQVLINIFKNAKEVLIENNVKYPLISVKTSEDESNIKLMICNNGECIPDSIIEKIFEPYFSTKDEKNGTGLGLYMSKIIIEKHLDGSIKVNNLEDGGVCFSIKYPKNEVMEDE